MPRRYAGRYCKVCNRPRDETGGLSRRGKCLDCAIALMMANAIGIRTSTGPFFEHWRAQTLRAFGGVPLDERQPPS